MTTRPWEEEWFVEFGAVMVKTDDADGAFVMTTGGKQGRGARLRLASKAPKMARAGLAAVNDVVANFAPNVGPMTADDIIGTGLETVEIPMKQFAALVELLREAGVLE